ncbi:MAG: glycosyltransferase family 4 protein [Candidatus Chisholmbacteria bacterium]|nr:glycosyltransferase family 4 protein [Candidatus Chisholmbacteria bacterium]
MLIDAWYPFMGGGQVHVDSLIKHLKKRHVQVDLFHSPHHHLFIRTLWSLWVIPQVIYRHAKSSYHLIHAHAFLPGIPGKILSVTLGLPVIFTVHGSHLMDQGKTGVKAFVEKLILTQIRYTHQITVTKSFTKYPNENKNISIISNGVDIKEFDNVKIKKNKIFTLLFVGRDHPDKGLKGLKQAFAIIYSKITPAKLRLITNGKMRGRNLVKEYKKAHAFVLPSLAEGQPLTVLEAWAAKLPVVATATAGVKELATPNYDSLIIKPGDQSQLENALIKIRHLPETRRLLMGERGYQKVKAQFTWDKITAKTIALYRRYV